MTELKACPFCGELPIFLKGKSFAIPGCKIKCNNFECWICPETSVYTEQSTAIEAWNRRADDDK